MQDCANALQVEIEMHYVFATAKPMGSRSFEIPRTSLRLRNYLIEHWFPLGVGFEEDSTMTP
jgi:hypothetical protein